MLQTRPLPGPLVGHILSNFNAYALMFLLSGICSSNYRIHVLQMSPSEKPHIPSLHHMYSACIAFITTDSSPDTLSKNSNSIRKTAGTQIFVNEEEKV